MNNDDLQTKIRCLEEKIDKIMCNHLPHIQIELEKVNSNLNWLLKFFWIIVSASLSALVVSIINIVTK